MQQRQTVSFKIKQEVYTECDQQNKNMTYARELNVTGAAGFFLWQFGVTFKAQFIINYSVQVLHSMIYTS